jgi:hypothetical protein
MTFREDAVAAAHRRHAYKPEAYDDAWLARELEYIGRGGQPYYVYEDPYGPAAQRGPRRRSLLDRLVAFLKRGDSRPR